MIGMACSIKRGISTQTFLVASMQNTSHILDNLYRIKNMEERKYLPTLSELMDRLSIAQLKEVFITEHKKEYAVEIQDILHDIDMMLKEDEIVLDAKTVRAIVVLKNIIQDSKGGRKDYKIDCLAAEFKDWEISWNEKA